MHVVTVPSCYDYVETRSVRVFTCILADDTKPEGSLFVYEKYRNFRCFQIYVLATPQGVCNQNFYNIPRACLLNRRSSVPAMDLKSNISGLWRHILETCRRLRRLCRNHSNSVVRHDKTPVKSTLLSRDMSFLREGVTLCCDFYTFRSCNTCTFSLTACAVLRHTTYFFAAVRYIIKHLFYETAWSIPFWKHKNDVTSLVKVHREYSPAARILHTKFE